MAAATSRPTRTPSEEQEIGVIPVDSIFSPIQRVRYRTENTRVGKLTNYDRLIMELWTDGTITPEMALVEASKIYRKHLNPFIQFFDVGKELLFESSSAPGMPTFGGGAGSMGSGSMGGAGMGAGGLGGGTMGAPSMTGSPATSPMSIPTMADPVAAPMGGGASGDGAEVRRKLELPIAHMDLSVRASNCLEAEGLQTIGDLVRRSQEEVMAFKNFGRTSLKEITRKLDELGLSLGMDVESV